MARRGSGDRTRRSSQFSPGAHSHGDTLAAHSQLKGECMAYEVAANLDDIVLGETLLVELSEPVCLIRLDE